MDLILTGRLVDADFAQKINLINRVLPGHDVLADAIETARMIAGNGPDAVQAVKRQITDGIAAHALSREEMEQKLGDEVRAGKHFPKA